jgi:hypothetical protein
MGGTRLTRAARPRAASAMAIAALLLSSCGGGSAALSKTDFLSGANDVCSQNQQQFNRAQVPPARTAAQAEKQAGALVSIAAQALNQLRGLKPPSDLQSAYDQYLSARQQALGYLENARDAAKSNNPQAYANAKRQEGNTLPTRIQLARKVGLTVCARPPVPVSLTGK